MKQGPTIFARSVVYLAGIAALAICFILLPELIREESVGKPVNAYLTYSFLAGAYVIAIPFFVALFQTLKLLRCIDNNQAFSGESIKILRNIKMCALIFIGLIAGAVISGVILARSVNPREDVTFMITLGGVFIAVPGVISVFIAVLQKLVAEAVALKSENDLIV